MQQLTDKAYEAVVSLEGVSKCFRRYDHPIDRLKEVLAANRSKGQEFWALNDINLKVYRGETLGFIGQNGSGKSTVLQIIAGTLQPTQGSVSVQGRVSALLELGSGFNPDFTGRQNVFFNGRILGLTQKEIEAKFDENALKQMDKRYLIVRRELKNFQIKSNSRNKCVFLNQAWNFEWSNQA